VRQASRERLPARQGDHSVVRRSGGPHGTGVRSESNGGGRETQPLPVYVDSPLESTRQTCSADTPTTSTRRRASLFARTATRRLSSKGCDTCGRWKESKSLNELRGPMIIFRRPAWPKAGGSCIT